MRWRTLEVFKRIKFSNFLSQFKNVDIFSMEEVGLTLWIDLCGFKGKTGLDQLNRRTINTAYLREEISVKFREVCFFISFHFILKIFI